MSTLLWGGMSHSYHRNMIHYPPPVVLLTYDNVMASVYSVITSSHGDNTIQKSMLAAELTYNKSPVAELQSLRTCAFKALHSGSRGRKVAVSSRLVCSIHVLNKVRFVFPYSISVNLNP